MGKSHFNSSSGPDQEEVDNFVLAAREGREKDVVTFLEKFPHAIDAKNWEGITALMWVAGHGDVNMLKLLLGKDAAINEVDKHGRTALMWAVMFGAEDAIHSLLENNADVSKRDKYGWSVAELANRYHQAELFAFLDPKVKERDMTNEIADFSVGVKGDLPAPSRIRVSRPKI